MSLYTRSCIALFALLAVLIGVSADTAAAKRQQPRVKQRAPVTVGVADQHGESFADPLFTALGVKHVRLNLAWDALRYDWQVAELDAWMAHAKATGVQPLVIFSQSRVSGRTRLLPSTAEFRQVVDEVLTRYPFVREFAAWNEANHTGQPTYRRPDAVAAYYKILVSRCVGCKVLPASLLDNSNIVPWTVKLRAAIRRLGLPEPRLWGLHNYSDVNYLRDRSTRGVMKAIKGKVWITESGGVVGATSPTASRFPLGAKHAARVAAFILGPMLLRSPQVDRVYFYNWKASADAVSWDSGLVAADGTPRPAYTVIANHLTASRIAAERAAGRLPQPGAPVLPGATSGLPAPSAPATGACASLVSCGPIPAAVKRLLDAGLPPLR